jgi:hypothetical protein
MTIVANAALFERALFCLERSHLHAGVIIGNSESAALQKNMEHAFNPRFPHRLKRGLVGDIRYFIA